MENFPSFCRTKPDLGHQRLAYLSLVGRHRPPPRARLTWRTRTWPTFSEVIFRAEPLIPTSPPPTLIPRYSRIPVLKENDWFMKTTYSQDSDPYAEFPVASSTSTGYTSFESIEFVETGSNHQDGNSYYQRVVIITWRHVRHLFGRKVRKKLLTVEK